MKKYILLLLSCSAVVQEIYAQSAITGAIDVGVTVLNAFNDDTTTFTTATDNTEVDITAVVDEFTAITIQFSGEGGQTSAIQTGDIFLESDIIGAFDIGGDTTRNVTLKIQGGLFTPEPFEVGEVKEYSDISDVIEVNTIAYGGAALVTAGYTDWVHVSAGARLDLNGTSGIGWMASVFGMGAAGPGILTYSVYATNQNGAPNMSYFGGFIDPTEFGVGIQYSALEFGLTTIAGNNTRSVPIVSGGIGAQFWIQPIVVGGEERIEGLEEHGNIWQYGINLSVTFLSFVDVVFDLRGVDGAPLDAIGVGIGISNLGVRIEQLFGCDLIFRAEHLGPNANDLHETLISIEPRVRLTIGHSGAQFRFGVPINIADPTRSTIVLDATLHF